MLPHPTVHLLHTSSFTVTQLHPPVSRIIKQIACVRVQNAIFMPKYPLSQYTYEISQTQNLNSKNFFIPTVQ